MCWLRDSIQRHTCSASGPSYVHICSCSLLLQCAVPCMLLSAIQEWSSTVILLCVCGDGLWKVSARCSWSCLPCAVMEAEPGIRVATVAGVTADTAAGAAAVVTGRVAVAATGTTGGVVTGAAAAAAVAVAAEVTAVAAGGTPGRRFRQLQAVCIHPSFLDCRTWGSAVRRQGVCSSGSHCVGSQQTSLSSLSDRRW